MSRFLKNIDRKGYKPRYGGLDIFKFIGPGLLVTVGCIDPGNWASNLAAGADYGYALLWMVTLSTIMLYTNSYRMIEKWIIAFVSVIGLSFLYELSLVNMIGILQ